MFKSYPATEINEFKNGFGKTNNEVEEFNLTTADVVDDLLISVIIPAYQEEKILSTISKIFTEENKNKYNLEVIISDGGSTDKTLSIARTFADEIVEHNLPTRQTIAQGRNNGAKVAKGDIFVFINADSIPEDETFFFSFIREWGKVQGKYSEFDALATYVTSFPDETRLKDKLFYKLHNFYVKLLNKIGIGMGRGECQIVKKEIFQKVGGYNESIAAGEDFELYHRISNVGKVGFVDDLKIFESPRRFRKYGYVKVVSSWFINSLFVLFLGKSIAKEWEAVR